MPGRTPPASIRPCHASLSRRLVRSRLACLSLPLVLLGGLLRAAEVPRLAAVRDGRVELAADHRWLAAGELAGDWTFMGATVDAGGAPLAIFEDFTAITGGMAWAQPNGTSRLLPKTAEPTWAEPASLYRGHTLKEVLASDHDLLGREILAQPDDPSFAAVAGAAAPIHRLETYSFVGTPDNADKVGVAYGGRTGNFDPAVYVPAIRRIRDDGRVLDGLVGGWQPVLRFVYPEASGDWTEFLLFAPWRTDLANPRIQPVWYRIARVEHGRLAWVRYFNSYHPYPPDAATGDAAGFYRDLAAMSIAWERALAPGFRLDLPDRRLADLARHSLVRAMMTRVNGYPKYGVLDRNYGGAEHDGFPDTFNVDLAALLAWGLFDRARDCIDNYFTHFVRDDGSLLYRGPETGQYGRMLTELASWANYTGDRGLLLRHRARIDAITRLLLQARRTALARPRDDPAYGMIAGWCEADSCLEADPARYVQPYFSNSAEAARGFGDLGAVWQRLGREVGSPELTAWGNALGREARALRRDLATALARSHLAGPGPACLPAIAGASEPPHVAAARDGADPQFRAYRAYMEMLYSGVLDRADAQTILDYREGTRDVILGVPTAYGYNSGEMAGFLSYGHAYGLLRNDRVREYLLTLYSLSAHQYSRGTWTAPETRPINPASFVAPYCVPAQLAVPLLVRWMLVFEDPDDAVLWLGRALPRDWLEDGVVVAASGVPTRWGRVGFRLNSHLAENRISADLDLPAGPAAPETRLRLRLPGNREVESVQLNGKPGTFDVTEHLLAIPPAISGHVHVEFLLRRAPGP